ncbi:hypothetical protein [Cognatazoarcus halotolerans]|uniref:hypothetical protein n=1 Tax=Cognatazoarcus halotolerans TaxID=2686016 RepID=UPI0013580958|nr:hypothetical protein [Cognatazoarcus halotolerans]
MNNGRNRGCGAVLAVILSMGLASAPALADKPDWAGNGKHEQKSHAKSDRHDRQGYRDDRREAGGYDRGDDRLMRHYFTDRHRHLVSRYYEDEFRSGHCPPGLAKKRNGCLPPGQARKWQIGRPLPRDVVYYDPPAAIVVELGVPPAMHRYVRVGADILLIAIGTGMVVDAIQDLGRM